MVVEGGKAPICGYISFRHSSVELVEGGGNHLLGEITVSVLLYDVEHNNCLFDKMRDLGDALQVGGI